VIIVSKLKAQMIKAGRNGARLNFSQGDITAHKKVIKNLRSAASALDRRIAIMAYLT
jgi:pyruvate kinase